LGSGAVPKNERLGKVTIMTVEGRTQKPEVDNSLCVSCDLCRLLCPDLCITLRGDKSGIEIDYEFCKGCGICESECPKGAIKMVVEE